MDRRSTEEKVDILKKIDALRGSGIPVKSAVKQIGIAQSQYYEWRKKSKKSPPPKKTKKSSYKKTPFVQDVQIHQPSQERVVCIIGTSNEIAEIIRGIK